ARHRGRAVRLLPVGPDHGRRRIDREDPVADRHRHRSGDVREHLSLRHLSTHPRGHQARREGRLTMADVSRREFLASAATGGGLLLGWYMVGSRVAAAAVRAAPAEFAPNAFIRIGADGRATLTISQIEMGQGVYTSLPMLLAEELEVGLDQVQV